MTTYCKACGSMDLNTGFTCNRCGTVNTTPIVAVMPIIVLRWERALEEVAKVAAELKAVRDAGFTGEALKWPRTPLELRLLCAFNGIKPEQAPPGWKYHSCEMAKKLWARVTDAAAAGGDALALYEALSPSRAGKGFQDAHTEKAWARVHAAAQPETVGD